MRKREKHASSQHSAPLWKGRDSLQLVHQLNQRCLTLLSDAASDSACEWPAITQHHELWCALDADTIQRAARFPFLILDLHFTDAQWWRPVAKPPATVNWLGRVLDELMQETLIFAWHTAKWDRRVARLSLGMPPSVTEAIAALTPQQLATVFGHNNGALCLRWHEDPDFWTRLLRAAKSGDNDALEDIHLHAKLLFCGQLLSLSPAGLLA